jgi:uncharacterized protein YeaO (DUF488 family)
MFKQGSVSQVRNQEIPREQSHIVITMCYYPRGVKKEWSDEFRNILAPSRELFKEWKDFEKSFGHDEAFKLSRYEERFELSRMALGYLQVYGESPKDTYFICQCEVGERCHREMLLLVVKNKLAGKVEKIFHDYPIFEKRIKDL